MELQRRQQDEAMLERIKRRVAGEKVDVPQVVQRIRNRFTPRASGTDSGRSQQCSTAGSSARRLLAGGSHTEPSGELGAGSGTAPVEDQGAHEPSWWSKVQQAAEQLTTHPDFQLVVMLVILLNCTGGWGGTLE